MKSDDRWKQEAIEKDMAVATKKLGKGKNVVISRFYKIKSLEKDKLLKIEMRAELYDVLKGLGINFDDFSKGEKMFEKDRDRFMNMIDMLGGKAEIVDKDSEYRFLFG